MRFVHLFDVSGRGPPASIPPRRSCTLAAVSLPSLPRVLPRAGSRVRVGTAGWSYPDWEGIVYPKPKPRGFDPLEWLARFLDVVEINTTFYRPARPQDARRWAERVAGHPAFRFTAKLDQVFTHHPEREMPASERAFKEGIAPLAEAGLLAAVLVQFPYSFRNTADNRQRLGRVLTRFAEYPLALEVRHRSWMTSDLLGFLSGRAVMLVGVDQPEVGQPILPALPLTGRQFYARLHGRNAGAWFQPDAGRDARYDYLYSAEELAPWLERIRQSALQNLEGIVIANNHYRGQAVVNAIEMRRALHEKSVPAPAELLAVYPRLAAAAHPLPAAGPRPAP